MVVVSQLLLLQIIAHLLTDFSFQSDGSARDKNCLGFKSKFLKWHVLITFALSWLLSFQWFFFIGAIAIAFTHCLIDGFKNKLNDYPVLNRHAFFIDQSLHLMIILCVVIGYYLALPDSPISVVPINNHYLMVFIGYLFCTKPANIFIKEILHAFKIQINNPDTKASDLPNAGKLIGIVERWLVLTFMLLGQFGAIGFLIAAKSILRFKDTDTLKTEYVLIGTMLSFGLAIVVGVVAGIV